MFLYLIDKKLFDNRYFTSRFWLLRGSLFYLMDLKKRGNEHFLKHLISQETIEVQANFTFLQTVSDLHKSQKSDSTKTEEVSFL